MLHDFAYSLEPELFIEAFNYDWPNGLKSIGYRKFEETDLKDMSRDEEISNLILEYI